MKITIAVCTWNWADSLRKTLEAFLRLQIPRGVEVQFLVVNNNCTDHTDQVIEEYSKKLPLTRLLESKQGLSHARNRAVSAATGELILFTDHDAIVQPDWLTSYVEASNRWPQAVYFGGVISPLYETQPPSWVKTNIHLLEGAVLIRNLGSEERRLDPCEQVFGANIAFRRSIFEADRFDANFGPSGKDLILGDETSFVARLIAKGLFGVWVPSAKVQHFVPKKRTSLKFVHRYFVAMGRTQIRVGGIPSGKKIWGVPRTLFRQWAEALMRAYFFRLFGLQNWFPHFLYAAELKGRIYESRKLKLALS